MKRKLLIFETIGIISILSFVLVVLGQNNGYSQNQKTPLVDRFERIIKVKETKFDGGSSVLTS